MLQEIFCLSDSVFTPSQTKSLCGFLFCYSSCTNFWLETVGCGNGRVLLTWLVVSMCVHAFNCSTTVCWFIYFFIVTFPSSVIFFQNVIHIHSVFRLLPFSAAFLCLRRHLEPRSQTFSSSLFHHISVSDEGRDLLSCLTVWAGLRVCSPSPLLPTSPSSLFASQPVWQCYPTTPVPRLQKPCLQLLRGCQPVRAFPLVGRTHCHTATLSLLAKFLSCFALLSFLLFFFYFFFLPLSSLFSVLAPPSLCLHIALLSRFPQ